MTKNTNIKFPPFIIGTMRLGEWGVKMTTPQLEEYVEECIALGLNSFDHADIYGHYTTEADFGQLLKTNPRLRDQIKITTKCGIKTITERRPSHTIASYNSTPKHIVASVEKSLIALNTDRIDLLLLHRPDYLLDPTCVAECLESLLKQGKVLHFGVSNFSASQFDMLNSFIPLETNQIEFSLSHRNALDDGTLDQCLKYSITPCVWSPLGGGSFWAENPTGEMIRIRTAISRMAKKYECSAGQILLAWIRKHPAGIIPVLGTSKIERIKAAVTSLKFELTHEDWYVLLEAARGYQVP